MSKSDIITKNIEIEELVNNFPFSVEYLAKNGIRCIVCGEPIWGTLEEAVKEKGFDEESLNRFINELNELRISFNDSVNENLNN